MRGNPFEQGGKSWHPARLRAEQGAELRLAPGAAQKHHQAASDRQGQRTSQVGLYQRQSQIDARGHAGRGENVRSAAVVVRVVGMQAVAQYLDLRIAITQGLHIGPMGCLLYTSRCV